MTTASTVLYIFGATPEFAGIVSAASPDLVPQGRKVSAWSSAGSRRLVERARRLVARPGSQSVHHRVTDSITVTDHASVTKWIDPDAPLEEKVEFLVARDWETQQDVKALREGVAALERAVPKELATLREETRRHVAGELDRAHGEYLPLRLIGVALIVVGLTCATLANFI